MITRICVSLPSACVSVDEEAAEHLLELFRKMTEAVNLLQDASLTSQWQKTLQVIAGSSSTSPVISGYATRLLSDFKQLQPDELVKKILPGDVCFTTAGHRRRMAGRLSERKRYRSPAR